jgi:hypothetical protein
MLVSQYPGSEGIGISVGDGVRKATLIQLMDNLTLPECGLWQKDSREMVTLRTTGVITFPSSSPASGISQASKSHLAQSYAAGLASLLLIRHGQLPPSISPLLLVAALLPHNERVKIANPKFLKLVFSNSLDQGLIHSLQSSDHRHPMDQTICHILEATGLSVSTSGD